jgi:hypothetical protein
MGFVGPLRERYQVQLRGTKYYSTRYEISWEAVCSKICSQNNYWSIVQLLPGLCQLLPIVQGTIQYHVHVLFSTVILPTIKAGLPSMHDTCYFNTWTTRDLCLLPGPVTKR